MSLHALAGQPAPAELLIDPGALEHGYYNNEPDPSNPFQNVVFGTSGHRGTTKDYTFTDFHIAAITQAICEYRASKQHNGPLFLGKDTHALSVAAERTALEVLAANGVPVIIQSGHGFTPTPSISRAILTHNARGDSGIADGIVVTPSHNPPSDGGFKYNPPNGGPAADDVTKWIQDRANSIMRRRNRDVKRLPYEQALAAPTTTQADLVAGYVDDLANIINLDAIRAAGLKIGVHPLGGASTPYWTPIAEKYGLNLQVVDSTIDPRFAFMTLDHDGKIRMDCSSPYAMAGLVGLKDQFDIAFGCDPDADRHGIVTRSAGLMNPNHYLAAAIRYLIQNRKQWKHTLGIGKTLVSSSILDRVAHSLHRHIVEVPVGFKWFVEGLYEGTLCFAGEESAGASLLRQNGAVWTTDKDGLILGLLAAEITAVTGKDPGEHYAEIESKFGKSYYARIDAPATMEQKNKLRRLSPTTVKASELAGETIEHKLTEAPGNDEPIGGLKVVAHNGWFAARPSGTENIYKVYAESFVSEQHLQQIIAEAQQIVLASL
jgi:phosphoglucomutase